MKIWVDGDACPKQIKYILCKAAISRKIPLLFVANHFVAIPASPFIKRIVVEPGFDKADQCILSRVEKNDLVVTSDILLAELVLENEAFALSSRGLLYTDDNIKSIVAMRNMNESLRHSGMIHGGPAALQPKEIVLFANQLDKLITRFHSLL